MASLFPSLVLFRNRFPLRPDVCNMSRQAQKTQYTVLGSTVKRKMLWTNGVNLGENLWTTCAYPGPAGCERQAPRIGARHAKLHPLETPLGLASVAPTNTFEEHPVSTDPRQELADIQLDTNNLYREENITDLRVGSIRKLLPVKSDGSDDPERQTLYMGQAQLMSQMGPLPVNCEIEASSLEEALEKFPDAVKVAVERMVEEVREMQREQASQIVVPGAGGIPPGGNIQLR